MSKSRIIVLAVTSGELTVSQAAARFGVSRQWVHQLLARFHTGGLDAVEPRSRRPHHNPHVTSDEVIIAIVRLREELSTQGLDAGPVTLHWHLGQAGLPVPSTSTIRRILVHHGLINRQPHKRPRSSYHRFTASPPPNPTNAGNRTSLTGAWPTAPTSRSSTGSTTTPDTCCTAWHSAPLAAKTS